MRNIATTLSLIVVFAVSSAVQAAIFEPVQTPALEGVALASSRIKNTILIKTPDGFARVFVEISAETDCERDTLLNGHYLVDSKYTMKQTTFTVYSYASPTSWCTGSAIPTMQRPVEVAAFDAAIIPKAIDVNGVSVDVTPQESEAPISVSAKSGEELYFAWQHEQLWNSIRSRVGVGVIAISDMCSTIEGATLVRVAWDFGSAVQGPAARGFRLFSIAPKATGPCPDGEAAIEIVIAEYDAQAGMPTEIVLPSLDGAPFVIPLASQPVNP